MPSKWLSREQYVIEPDIVVGRLTRLNCFQMEICSFNVFVPGGVSRDLTNAVIFCHMLVQI